MDFNASINSAVDDNIENLFGDNSKVLAKMTEQGVKQSLIETATSQYMLKRQIIDTGTYVYIGFAQAGTLTSVASWFVCRIDASGNQLHADGNTNFDNVFDNYASLTYK